MSPDSETKSKRTIVALKVTVEAPDSLPPLPAAVEVAAYRIVQEAVTNVIRHAHAHSCYVCFHVQDALQIEVSDDGKGIEDTDRSGVGLTSMRERAEELGGTFTINKVLTVRNADHSLPPTSGSEPDKCCAL